MIRPAPTDVEQSCITTGRDLITINGRYREALHSVAKNRRVFYQLWKKMTKDLTGMQCLTWAWLVLWIFQFQLHPGASIIIWTANVEVSYISTGTNQTVINTCKCGIYGLDSPLQRAFGSVVLPSPDPLACFSNISFTVTQQPWIALIKRGNCSHAEKIRAAQEEGASAVVIYNVDGTGNETSTMSHPGTGSTVAIMIGNVLGTEIANLIKSGTEVYMDIKVAGPHGPVSPLWIYIMSFTFFAITVIILSYFIVIVFKRLYRNQQLRIQQRELKKVAEKAIAKLQVRTLRRTDPEIEAEDYSCAVCIDSFKRGDVVTNLPCRHVFHKTCIEPWLLEHHTCPMCKYDILKGEVGVEAGQASSLPPADVRFYPSTVTGSLPATADALTLHHTDTWLSLDIQAPEAAIQVSDPIYEDLDTRKKEHVYENPTFEQEQQCSDHQGINCQTHQM
ncbi:RING finger protein 148 [Electrophorus electricus]|uniref:RING finger protein 148 n=1 Tax=Electrophorus electricus TaxID=8005 RepID=UPI0015CFC7F0|nr:RING finger protein 148 [Electrophorus electricus]